MTERSWGQLVAEGKRLVREETVSTWALADLILEAVPPSTRGRPPKALVNAGVERIRYDGSQGNRLRRFGEAVGISEKRGAQLRWCAAQWPAKTRNPNATFSTHKVLAGCADRFSLIKECRVPKDAYALRPALNQHRLGTVKGALALKDPAYARRVLQDPEVRQVIVAVLAEFDPDIQFDADDNLVAFDPLGWLETARAGVAA